MRPRACAAAPSRTTSMVLAAMALLGTPALFAATGNAATRNAESVAGMQGSPAMASQPAAPIQLAPAAPSGTALSPPGSAAASSGVPDEDIRDIRGPKPVPLDWFWPTVIAGLIVLAIAAYLVWRWQRRRRAARALLPFEIALRQLEALRPLMQPATAREFSIAVSDIVRRYIEERFQVTAAHRTTEEFLHDLLNTSNTSLAKYRPLLAEFLHECDLVKFAGVSLSQATMESLHQSGRSFVLETAKPDPTAAPAI